MWLANRALRRVQRRWQPPSGEVDTLTLLSWNIESFAPRHLPDGTEPLAEIVARSGSPDMVCLQELRVRPEDGALARSVASALPGYVGACALSRDRRNASFRGGRMHGVATYVRESLGPTRLRSLDWDREGRVLVAELDALKLAVVNVYAPNGTAKPYYDQDGRIEGDRNLFKRRFNRQLMQDGAALGAQGLALVLIGDWNISRSAQDTCPRLRTEAPHALAREEFNEVFIPTLGVVDVFRHLHPAERRYTWFNRRAPAGRLDAARVDFALVSEGLLPKVTEAGIGEPQFGSDHAPVWVTLAI